MADGNWETAILNLDSFFQTYGNESTEPQTRDIARRLLEIMGMSLFDRSWRKAVGFRLDPAEGSDRAICSEALLNFSSGIEVPGDEMRPNGPFARCVALPRQHANLLLALTGSTGAVKLAVKRNDGSVIVGTGVLVRADIVAAVGHLLEDKGRYAVEVVAHAGYGSESVERRRGKCAVVRYEWYNRHNPANDLAFVPLQSEFNEHITPIPSWQTPIVDDNTLTGRIFGYSGDMPSHAPGQRLTMSCSALQYNNCDASGLGVLQRRADTWEGASGGAALDDGGYSIGLHTG
ncbi:hypothetical protein B0T14DRAFT_495391 [Immersiella caudata]|uniref:Peptidase S1 domain-containing protein n=1 Tax=Immersiella caudata TaxID=314043 RepID=A0AA39WYL9_9PEZI|nr:hypothetical protein B0T14DRAFT_495391 [Immersiella caudata]